jgi:hypothetical protein
MQPPEGSVFFFKPVLNWMEKLRGRVFHRDADADDHLEEPLCGERYKELVDDILGALELGGSARAPLEQLVARFYGKALGVPERADLAWLLASGRETLKAGQCPALGFKSVEGEWAAMRVEHVQYTTPSRLGRLRLSVHFRSFGGAFGGLPFRTPMAYDYVTKVFAKDLGLPRYQRAHYREIVDLWLVGYLVVDEKLRPRLEYVHMTSTALAHNRTVRMRRREPCPREYRWPCHDCTVGYLYPDACPRATHPWTYTKKRCDKCETEGWFDPTHPGPFCVKCRERFVREGGSRAANAKPGSGRPAVV